MVSIVVWIGLGIAFAAGIGLFGKSEEKSSFSKGNKKFEMIFKEGLAH